MSVQYIQKKSLGTETTPTSILDSTAGKAVVQNRSKAAGIAFDVATGEIKYNGADVVRTMQSGVFTSATLITTRTVLASESGMTFFLNLVGGFTVTLPALAAGLNYRFIVKLAPTTAYIISPTDADSIIGGVYEASGGAGDSGLLGDPGDQVNFVASTSLTGDSCDFFCDGAVWYIRAFTQAAGGITVTG